MLTLTRRRRRSIYSLSAKGGEMRGYMGLGPVTVHTQAANVRPLLVVQWLVRDRTSGRARTSAIFVLLKWYQTSGDGRSSSR